MNKTFSLEEEEEEFILIGLNTISLPDYKLAYLLNKELALNLERMDDLDVTQKGVTQCYSLYKGSKENTDYYLFAQKAHIKVNNQLQGSLFAEIEETAFLLKKRKFYNYFLKINTEITEGVDFTLPLMPLDFIKHFKIIDDLTLTEKSLIYI